MSMQIGSALSAPMPYWPLALSKLMSSILHRVGAKMANFLSAHALPWFDILGISGGFQPAPLSIVGDVAILLEKRNLMRTSRNATHTSPADAFPAPRRMGRKKKRKRPEPAEFAWGHVALLGSGKSMARTGGSTRCGNVLPERYPRRAGKYSGVPTQTIRQMAWP